MTTRTGNGDGQTTKVANQIIVALNIEVAGEARLFASRILGVHGERMGYARWK